METEIRVRYAETDQMGIAYYTNYLVWFEVGRTEWCRASGFTYRELEAQEKIYLMVADAQVRYKAPARYDDLVVIRTSIKTFKKRLIIFAYEARLKETGELLASGETTHIVTDPAGRPRSLPPQYWRFFESK